jgi:ribosomal protein S18 acetylase RimI-like enzyme
MTQAYGHELITKQALANSELILIQHLADTCNHYEDLHMRLNWSMLRQRPGHETNDFLYYQDGYLIGYLAIDSFGDKVREVTGMVHPNYRRQGIFSTLLEAAKTEGKRRGLQKLVLVCEEQAPSGQAFIEAIGAQHEFSEHEMVLTHFQESGQFDERLIFRKAYPEDEDLLVAIQTASFAESEEQARSRIETCNKFSWCQFYLTTFGDDEVGCQEPVGCLRLDTMEEETGIYTFGVVPAYRRRGYGRQMLEEAIRTVRATSQKPIMLDVETTNTPAVKLYLSSGFQIKTTYAYYALPLS